MREGFHEISQLRLKSTGRLPDKSARRRDAGRGGAEEGTAATAERAACQGVGTALVSAAGEGRIGGGGFYSYSVQELPHARAARPYMTWWAVTAQSLLMRCLSGLSRYGGSKPLPSPKTDIMR